ncbi:hypothetical protein OB955_05270 [Halobacteria archaeon AArc-m2/3/4]|uniref:Uncharacterized protein n=1 Tax=Natronoglomus mannanivorans TaxID=2979990 RepID=A0ABT2QB39_9EURY|nr:hypothetical protein [Halobacteria archaeon AArc-m2/3/4]
MSPEDSLGRTARFVAVTLVLVVVLVLSSEDSRSAASASYGVTSADD